MKPAQQVHEAGQSLWLANITRSLLACGTMERYIDEDSVTGLASNPAIFDKAIEGGGDYDAGITAHKGKSASDEEVSLEQALHAAVRGCSIIW